MEEWNIEKIKEYISQFKTRKQFEDDQEYDSIRDFFKGNRDLKTWKELISDLEGLKKNRDLEYAKKYIEDNNYKTFEEFKNSPEYSAINSSIYKNYGKEGWQELVSGLEKERTRWNLKLVDDYISRFSNYTEFRKSPGFKAVKEFIVRWQQKNPSQPGKWLEVTSKLERDREYNHTIEKIKDYVSQFTTFNEFEADKNYKKYNKFIYSQDDGPEIWADVTSKLEKGKKFKGEENIVRVLNSLGYSDVKQHKSIKGCFSFKSTDVKCFPLWFDVYFIDEKGKQILIEYDGIFHFESNPKRGGEKKYDEQVKNDILKNKYTKDNGLKFIRIGYLDFNDIEDELKSGLESTDQLYLSTNYPKKGWNANAPMDDIMKPNLKKEYIVTESQLQRILESSEEEKIKRFIKKYILSNFDTVKDVNFHTKMETQSPTSSTPSLEKKVIEVIFDRSKLTFVEMLHIQYEIREHLNNYFDLKTFGRGSEWELTADTQR